MNASIKLKLTISDIYELSGICSVVLDDKFENSMVINLKNSVLEKALIYVEVGMIREKLRSKADKWNSAKKVKGKIWFNAMQQHALETINEIIESNLIKKILAHANPNKLGIRNTNDLGVN